MLKYTKKVIQHFLKPKNVGEIKDADGVGKAGNPVCGDVMHVYIKVGKKKVKGREEEIIKNARFQTLGCPAAIAASDVLCELVKGKTLKEAEKIEKKDIVKKLGGLPPIKIHCSVLGARTLKKAIEDYRNKRKKKNSVIPLNLIIKKEGYKMSCGSCKPRKKKKRR